jgi:hypothetical protein
MEFNVQTENLAAFPVEYQVIGVATPGTVIP